MYLSSTNLNIFFTSAEARWFTAFTTTPTWHDRIATDYPCDSENFVAAWIGMLQKMRPWNGSRVVHNAAPNTYSVQMQTFELTYGIDQFVLRNDKYSIYAPLPALMAKSVAKNPDLQLRDLLQNVNNQTGVQQNCYDGLSYFNTAHPVDPYDASKGTYCTDFTGGGVSIGGITVGGALNTISFNTLYQEFCSRKSEMGEALGIYPNLLQHPAQLLGTAKTILQTQTYSPAAVSALTGHETFVGAMSNPFEGMVDLMMTADLNAQAQTWFLWDTMEPIKPLGRAVNIPATFAYRMSLEDPVVFNQHQFLMGCFSREVPLWGLPWMGARSSN